MLKTFPKGGTHPPENKLSADKAIETLALPDKVFIPLAQHIGAPCEAVVKKGDTVKAGQLIAKSTGFVSTNIHSSVSGTVEKIDNVIETSGYPRPTAIIKREGDDWAEGIDTSNQLLKECSLSADEIVNKCLECGIVGLGGATFPSHVKLNVPKGKTAEILLINGVECEPYLTSDHRLMLEKADEMLVGTSIIMKALGVAKAVIGIENNKPDAIKHLEEKVKHYKGISVQALKVKYPQGGEKQLIKAVTGREVPSGGLPIEVGAVVHNVGTAYAIYEAVQKNKPLVERVVTITGKAVKNPANYMVRVGTPVNALIEAAGGMPTDTGKIISGGPMMGKALNTTDAPVTKGTSGILLMTIKEAKRQPAQNCIRCAKCVSVCPMALEPYLLNAMSERARWEEMEQDKVMDCIECGSCAYTCPASLPLLDYIRLGKANVGKMIRERSKK